MSEADERLKYAAKNKLPDPKSDDPQFNVFLKAMIIYYERQEQHGDQVWQASGWRGMLTGMYAKMERAWYRYWNADPDEEDLMEALDSAYDLLNYTAFFIRQVEARNRDGSWPWQLES